MAEPGGLSPHPPRNFWAPSPSEIFERCIFFWYKNVLVFGRGVASGRGTGGRPPPNNRKFLFFARQITKIFKNFSKLFKIFKNFQNFQKVLKKSSTPPLPNNFHLATPLVFGMKRLDTYLILWDSYVFSKRKYSKYKFQSGFRGYELLISAFYAVMEPEEARWGSVPLGTIEPPLTKFLKGAFFW